MSFFDRLRAGWAAAKACLEVLRNDKTLVVFPLMSGLAVLLVLASFAIPLAVIKPAYVQTVMSDHAVHADRTPIWVWVVMFAFYFCNYFVIYFFNAALVHCAISHFRRQPVSASDGLRAAIQRLPQLLVWSLVSATVGLVLRLIENANEKFGWFVSALLGGAWTVVTFFVVPVLVVERVGPLQAIQRSWQVLRKTWGESIAGHVGVGWALLPFWLLGVLAAFLGVMLLSKSIVLGGVILAITVVFFLILGLVDATLKGILLSALYLYSTNGEVPDEFDRDSLVQSFTRKNAK